MGGMGQEEGLGGVGGARGLGLMDGAGVTDVKGGGK